MQLFSIKIDNYKCFGETGPIPFGGGFNVVIGKNGAGKSSFLQVIRSIFGYNPRKSLETVPYYGAQNPKPSSGVFKVNLTPRELEEFILDAQLRLSIPDPANQHEYKRGLATWAHIKKNTEMLETCFSLYAYVLNPDNDALARPDNKCFLNLPYISTVSGTGIGRSNQERGLIEMGYSEPPKLAADVLKQLYRSKCMLLTAQRPNPYKSYIGISTDINHDGSNLPEVLLRLHSSPNLRQKYIDEVKEVLPEITDIISRPISSSECEVFVYYHDTKIEREDLAFSHECGTGVGQVLTILYAAICSKFPKLIAIDEPNSFLHPGAARRLIQVLKRYEQHQYILATHSPELIKVAQPSYIHLISSRGGPH